MDRRSLLAIVITFAILIGWEALYMAPKRNELARRHAAELESGRQADSLAALEQPAGLVLRTVEDDQTMAGVHEMARHRRPHHTGADERDRESIGHEWYLL